MSFGWHREPYSSQFFCVPNVPWQIFTQLTIPSKRALWVADWTSNPLNTQVGVATSITNKRLCVFADVGSRWVEPLEWFLRGWITPTELSLCPSTCHCLPAALRSVCCCLPPHSRTPVGLLWAVWSPPAPHTRLHHFHHNKDTLGGGGGCKPVNRGWIETVSRPIWGEFLVGFRAV